jgi:hypothetical protein
LGDKAGFLTRSGRAWAIVLVLSLLVITPVKLAFIAADWDRVLVTVDG